MIIEISFETGRIFVMKGIRGVLVKVLLFHLRELCPSQVKVTPNIIKNFIYHSDLSKEVYNVFVSNRYQEKFIKNLQEVVALVRYFLELVPIEDNFMESEIRITKHVHENNFGNFTISKFPTASF